MRSSRRMTRLTALVAAAVLLFAACGDDDDGTDVASGEQGSLTVAGSDFLEQDIVANIYAAALRHRGYDVTVKPHLGKREVVQPALENGEVDVLPEYVGSLLEYLEKGSATGDLDASVEKLRDLLEPKKLTALDPAEAYDANALVVTKATAEEHNLKKTSDLAAVAKDLTLGGPPECPTRPLCAPGYKDKYGIEFKTFKPLDAGGPITKKALTDGDIDVALLFSSDVPADTVVLEDDKGLQPAENLIPVIRTDKATDDVKEILNKVSAALSLEDLVELNAEANSPAKPDPADLAEAWVEENVV